jgi:hypothetical protein
VEQISLPYRIALVVLLAVGVLWFAVLRPKAGGDAAPATTPAPGVTGLANDVSKAKGTVDASNASAARTNDAANAVGASPGSTTSAATAPHAAKPGKAARAAAAKAAAKAAPKAAVKPATTGLAADAAPGDPSRPLLADVDAGKVVVVLFWNKAGSDDRATRHALSAVDRHKGKVVTTAIPVGDVGKYEAITRGAQVLESPTILVIGHGGKARAITGYTQASEIDQAVSDVGGKGFEAKKAFHLTGFAKTADDVCRDSQFALDQKTDLPTSRRELIAFFDTGAREMGKARAKLQHAPAKSAADKALKASLVRYAATDSALAATSAKQLHGAANPAAVVSTFITKQQAAHKVMAAAAAKRHVRGCYAA